jgi:hypothetical protein
VAKLAPNTERLTGSVAPKRKRLKANLGKARFVHQKGISLLTTNTTNSFIYYSIDRRGKVLATLQDLGDASRTLPNGNP